MGWLARMGPVKPRPSACCGALRPTGENTSIQIAGFDIARQAEQAPTLATCPSASHYMGADRVGEYPLLCRDARTGAAGGGRAVWISWSSSAWPISSTAGQDTSGGMKQKLGLAAALVHRPGVLLLDEPTTGVDPVTRQDFWQLIIRLAGASDLALKGAPLSRRRAWPSWFSTPYMDEAARCGRVGFVRQGRMLVEGAPAELRASLDGRILELRGRPLPLLRRRRQAAEGVEDAQMFGDRLHRGPAWKAAGSHFSA